MVADLRLTLVQPLRLAVATVLMPVQWLAWQPVRLAGQSGQYLKGLQAARSAQSDSEERQSQLVLRAHQVDQLLLENSRLRELMGMRERIQTSAIGAQVLYDMADPFSRKVVLDRGLSQGVQAGSPVVDEFGVLGQVTQVYPGLSQLTLLIDRNQAIPVLNTRTGVRSVLYGRPDSGLGLLELRFSLVSADIEVGDLLSTSGVDGIYPPGLPVAKVVHIDRRADSSFARVECAPLARMDAALHVQILQPVGFESPKPVQVPDLPQRSSRLRAP